MTDGQTQCNFCKRVKHPKSDAKVFIRGKHAVICNICVARINREGTSPRVATDTEPPRAS